MTDEIKPTSTVNGEFYPPTPEETQGATETPAPEPEKVKEQEPPKEPEIDYKKKFSESSREAQRLAKVTKELEKKYSAWQSLEAQGLKPEDVETYLKNGTGDLNAVKIQRDLEEIKQREKLREEEANLSRLISKIPEVEPLKETLRALGRANPEKSFEELYEEHLNPAINLGQQRVYSKLEQKKASQVESGKGSGEGTQSISLDDFNKLPVDKQQQYLKEKGM